ncbi:AraC family transcriptional regulator [Paenibacillus anaericanus]|uniref:AraC family transcriptional regulator n=1 Tax=Paenibacillus anaericanus TaxID=170367 RepID=A0A433YF57_9BACL|nr:AraC family transcriptional regulator [Paenibacillus anaericanus]RUT48483.1 AraC family transcriptional regulator [Paenibacillus anaericanus]
MSVTELLLDNRTLEFKQHKGNSLDLNVSYRRENTWLHHEPILERELFRHIKNGNKTELMRTYVSFPEEKYGLLSKKSHLRSKKNLAVSSVTLATHAAIDGGLFRGIAYTLSGFHIQYIEELKDIDAVKDAELSGISLSDIATRLQFNDQSYFTKVFKKYTGTTPKQFRNNSGITL